MSDPIEVRPGVYTEHGKESIMGLCIVIDAQEAGWQVKKSNGKIIVTIPSNSSWRVMKVPDPDNPDEDYLQIFRIGGNLNSLALQSFLHPTEDVHTPNSDHPSNKPPAIKILYSHPDQPDTNSTQSTAPITEPKPPKKKKQPIG